MLMKQLRFGIEIETVGATRAAVARAIHGALPGSTLDTYSYDRVTDANGRVWKVVRDGSLSGGENSGEVVSPILGYEDLDTLQNIVRAVRGVGARADQTCGIHIHVDGSSFDAKSVLNLVKLMYRQEKLLEHVLGVSAARLSRYCRSIEPSFVERLEARRPSTMADVSAAWYGRTGVRPDRYDSSRYHGLNLNSLFFRGTIEFRYFEGTLHAGKVKAYVQLVLALAARALTSKAAAGSRKPFDASKAKYGCRIFLKHLGLVGAEFKTARHHLMSGLAGCCNYRGVRPVAAPASVEATAAEEVADAAQ